MNDNRTLREDAAKDPQTLEREIEETRIELNKILDVLERKLTPGQLLDQCLGFFGKTGSDIANSLGNAVQENPIPLLLTATGIGWMMCSSGRDSSAKLYDNSARKIRDDSADAYRATAEGLSKMGAKIKSGAASAGSQVTHSKDTVTETINNTADTVAEKINNTADLAQTQARRAREGFSSMLEEQPLMLGALGLAVGAAIGAAIPSTEQEDRLMGNARDRAVAKGNDVAAKTYEKGRETAKQTVEESTESTH